MPRPQGTLIFTIICILLFALSIPPPTSAMFSGRPGFDSYEKPAPAAGFRMLRIDGTPLDLADLRGKVVLLNFWRFNCRYCSMEKEHLKRMRKKFGRDDVEVVCVNLWDSPSRVKRYARKRSEDFLFATRDGAKRPLVENIVKGRHAGYFVLNGQREAVYEIKGFPSTYVIDREGRVVAGRLGMAEWDSPEVVRRLSALTAEGQDGQLKGGREYEVPQWVDQLLSYQVGVSQRRASFAGRTVNGPIR